MDCQQISTSFFKFQNIELTQSNQKEEPKESQTENMANAVQHRDGFQPAGINNQNPLAQNNGFGAHAQD